MDKTTEIQKKEQPAPWYKKLWHWILILFQEEYEVSIWYVYETLENENVTKVTKRVKETYIFKKITKRTNKHIAGIDQYGMPFEIKTVNPFDYEIRKTK